MLEPARQAPGGPARDAAEVRELLQIAALAGAGLRGGGRGGEPARGARRRRLRRPRARARADARGRGRRARRPRRLLLLVGEPGIGKTRAAEELATYAQVSGARGLLGPLPRGRGRARLLALGAGDPRPTSATPTRSTGLADGRRAPPRSPSSCPRWPSASTSSPPAHRRRRGGPLPPLRLGHQLPATPRRDRPMVLVLDDLHWADEPSLLLLQVRRPASSARAGS